MKQGKPRPLALATESIRTLTTAELRAAGGGTYVYTAYCYPVTLGSIVIGPGPASGGKLTTSY